MKAWDLLSEVRKESREIAILRNKHEWLRLSLIPGAQMFKTGRIQAMPEDRMGDTVAEIDRLERRIYKQIGILTHKQNKCLEYISRIDDSDQRKVLMLYYLPDERLLSLEEVAAQIGYSRSRVKQIRREGVSAIQKMIDTKKQ